MLSMLGVILRISRTSRLHISNTPLSHMEAVTPAQQGPWFSTHRPPCDDTVLQVVYGLDYFVSEAAERLERLKGEVVSHLAAAPDALLVVEEYDKLSCEARGMWRQLLQHPQRANITSHRHVLTPCAYRLSSAAHVSNGPR